MRIKVERETKWQDNEMKTCYYIWVDGKCTALTHSFDKAMGIVKQIETSEEKIGTEIVYENEI
jgi:hypothetical protein